MAIDSANNLYRPDIAPGSYPVLVSKYTYNGVNSFTKTALTATNFTWSGSNKPSSVALDSSFNVYVLDAGTGSILEFSPNGSNYTDTTLYQNNALLNTTGLSRDSYGNFYVASGPDWPYAHDDIKRDSGGLQARAERRNLYAQQPCRRDVVQSGRNRHRLVRKRLGDGLHRTSDLPVDPGELFSH